MVGAWGAVLGISVVASSGGAVLGASVCRTVVTSEEGFVRGAGGIVAPATSVVPSWGTDKVSVGVTTTGVVVSILSHIAPE